MRRNARPIVLLAVTGMLAALALAGCGRKGPLDPPPAAAVTGDQAAPAAPAAPMAAPFGSRADAANPALGPDGKPLAPKGPNKHIFLDDILN